MTIEKLAAAEARAEQQTKVAFSYEESLQRSEARVRELETHNASLRERNTELVHLKQVAEARVRELESRIERQRVANRGMHRSLDERDAELAALRERVARALAALESPAWPPLARIQDTLEALRG